MCFTLIHALPPFEDPTYLTSTVLGSMAHGLDRSLIDWSIERLSRHVPCASLDARGKKQITHRLSLVYALQFSGSTDDHLMEFYRSLSSVPVAPSGA